MALPQLSPGPTDPPAPVLVVLVVLVVVELVVVELVVLDVVLDVVESVELVVVLVVELVVVVLEVLPPLPPPPSPLPSPLAHPMAAIRDAATAQRNSRLIQDTSDLAEWCRMSSPGWGGFYPRFQRAPIDANASTRGVRGNSALASACDLGDRSRPTMPKIDRNLLIREATEYLKQHPEEIFRALRGMLGLRFGVPMDAIRYFAREFGGGPKAPKDVVVEAAPPGLRLGATVDAMGTPLRALAVVYIEELDISTTQLRVGIRIEGLTLTVLGDSNSPLGGLLKSGALDLSKPGNLVAFMPKRPPALIDAKDDRLVVDLMKVPQIAANPKLKRALEIVTPILGVRALKTKDDHLDLYLKADLAGVPLAIAAARA